MRERRNGNITLDIEFQNIQEIKSKLIRLGKNAPKVISRAINRTITNVKKNISVETRVRYSIKAANIKKAITAKQATSNSLRGEVKIKGKKLPLGEFPYKATTIQSQKGISYIKRKLYRVKVLKEKPHEKLKHAFLQNVKGEQGLYLSSKASKYHPYMALGPSIPQMVGKEEVWKKIETKANETLQKRMDHEIKRLLEGK